MLIYKESEVLERAAKYKKFNLHFFIVKTLWSSSNTLTTGNKNIGPLDNID